MGNAAPEGDRFRERIARERAGLGWSQAEVAKRLTAMGIDKMHHTTVAKIESGDREIKLDEAAAMADLYGLSLDFALGRKQLGEHNQIAQDLKMLCSVADRHVLDLQTISGEITRWVPVAGLGGVPEEFVEAVRELGSDSDLLWQDLSAAIEHLHNLRAGAVKLLDRLSSKRRDATK